MQLNKRIDGMVLFIILSMSFFTFLEYISYNYLITVDRLRSYRTLEIGFNIELVLIMLVLLWSCIQYKEGNKEYLIISITGGGLFFILKNSLVVSLLGVIIVGYELFTRREFYKYFFGFSVVCFIMSFLALFYWVVMLPLNVQSPFLVFAQADEIVYNVLSDSSPLLVFPLLFFWVVDFLGSSIFKDGAREILGKCELKPIEKTRISTVLILLAICVSFFSAIYPYLKAVNSEELVVGVDIPNYLVDLSALENKEFSLFDSERPIFFLLVLGFKKLFSLSPDNSINYMPILLNPLLVVSFYFFSHSLRNDRFFSSWAAFFTATGFQITVGMYSYYLANNLCLILIFLSFGSFFKSIKGQSNVWLIVASVLGVFALYTHPWTFDQYFFAFLGLFVSYVYYFLDNGAGGIFVRKSSIYILSVFIAESLKYLVFNSVGGVGALSEISVKYNGTSLFWNSSITAFRILYDGGFSNLFLLILAVFGIFLLSKGRIQDKYVKWLFFVSGLLYLLFDGSGKSRLLYNIPLGYVAAYAMSYSLDYLDKDTRNVWLFAIITGSINYVFRFLASIV